jgi:hypothetical protein
MAGEGGTVETLVAEQAMHRCVRSLRLTWRARPDDVHEDVPAHPADAFEPGLELGPLVRLRLVLGTLGEHGEDAVGQHFGVVRPRADGAQRALGDAGDGVHGHRASTEPTAGLGASM